MSALPDRLSLAALKRSLAECRGRDLYRDATQAVPGEGPRKAHLVFVGEVPGDQEDRAGKPFVGPAGKLLDSTLEEVGIPRDDVYVTNAVKHFKYERRGKQRIHQKPTAREIRACFPWVRSELELLKPAILVALGATAAKALFGSSVRVTRDHGQTLESPWAEWSTAVTHPSAVLRVPQRERRREARDAFRSDLETIAGRYRKLAP